MSIKCSNCGKDKNLSYVGVCRNSENTYYCSSCDCCTYLKGCDDE